jgi:hypothetical protein
MQLLPYTYHFFFYIVVTCGSEIRKAYLLHGEKELALTALGLCDKRRYG